MVDLLDAWAAQRKGARVLMVLDVSGSMGEPADPADVSGPTRLDLAKEAVVEGLGDFKPDDEVGLRVFTTDDDGVPIVEDLAPIAPIGANREELISRVNSLAPQRGTPLYEVTQTCFTEMLEDYDPALINAVILLSDGENDDGDPTDDDEQFESLIWTITENTEGENTRPVRIFTVAYGGDADATELGEIAEASNATAYVAADATTIQQVFTSVVSNF